MTRFRSHVVALVACGFATLAMAQTATPVPQAPSPPAPAAAQPQPPSSPPAVTPPAANAAQAAAFGEAVDLPVRQALMLDGNGSWDNFFPASRQALEQLERTAKAQGMLPSGFPMVRVQTANDDTVIFTAVLPIMQMQSAPLVPIAPVKLGEAPSGPHLKFTHTGGYDTIEITYDEIANYLDEKGIVVEDYFVEEYPMDPNTTPETELVTYIYVRLKQ